MKTDRELLELAAKAFFSDGPTYISNEGFMDWVRDCKGEWNPLTDDGDALRLAVYLGVEIEFSNTAVYAGPRNTAKHAHDARYDNDAPKNRLAATRRAITRAAAEIGEGME